MKFILGIFSAGLIVVIYNYFAESNEPPRNLIKAILECFAIICIIIFLQIDIFFYLGDL